MFVVMMEAEADSTYLFVELDGRGHRSSAGELAELVEAVKDWTVLAHIEPLEELAVLSHVVRPDGPEEPDVVVTVELGHLVLSGLVRPVHLHLTVEPVVEEEVVGHPHPVRLHGVALAIIVVPNVTVVVVTDF